MISKILIRSKIMSEPILIQQKRVFLQKRQTEQLQLLEQYVRNKKVDQSLTQLPLKQLQSLRTNGKEQIFASFTAKNLNPWVRNLRGLADLNIQHILKKPNIESLIPFTVKDHIRVDNMIQTAGFSHNIYPAQESGDIINFLEGHSCVAYGQSNVPQGLLGIQSNNNVYGLSQNPYKRRFVSGGSTGGQAIQVATKSSAFGVGSDTAGSIRIPAAFSGVYGFKPSSGNRLSTKGRVGVYSRQTPVLEELPASMGFITRRVSDIRWLCQKTLGVSPDSNPYIKNRWDDQKYLKSLTKKFRVGYIDQSPEMKTAPAIKNAMQDIISILKADGHQVVPFDFPELYKFKDFCFSMFKISGFIRAINNRLGLEQPMRFTNLNIQHIKYGALGCLFRQFLSQTQQQSRFYRNMRRSQSMSELFQVLAQKQIVKNLFINKWNQQKIELLLSPVMPFTAPLANHTQYLVNQLTFCCFQNVLKMPAGSIPIRLVKDSQAKYDDHRFYGSKVKSSIQQSSGLPISLQITSQYLQDQVCVAAMQKIQQLLFKNHLGIGKAIPEPSEKNW